MKKIISVLLAAAMAFALAACGGAQSSAPASSAPAASSAAPGQSSSVAAYATSLDDIKVKGELVIGLDDTFAPMGFRDENGDLVGFDIDLATAVCEVLGVKPVFQPIDWDAKELELSTGKIDCIWNGMSITPEREQSMSLSNAYLNNKIIIMTNKGVTIASKDDLANYNLGTQADSSALEVVKGDPIYDSIKDKLTEYKTYDQVIMDMQAGRIDAMIVDEVLGQYKNTQLGNVFEVAPVDFGEDLYAIGLRKSDTELTDAINAAMKTCIDSGTAAEISTKWFGSDIMVK
ncbi:MAG: amino acid ABC transporter substrate-binding protein [Pygmaiobacter sp.]|nr:amino acid ABC transporter substrate-binding protein [Pygmaiobacter sp.]